MENASHCITTGNTLPDAPLAFVAKVRGSLTLYAVDEHARQLGIVPGLGLVDARARHPNLITVEADEEADRHWLDRLLRRCMRWSPLVTLAQGDGITLDIAGSDHLFGGEAGLIAQVEDDLAGLGMTVRLVTADTAAAAQALARHAPLPVEDERRAIHALPVAALGLDADATLALHRAGLKAIGDVAVRPMAGVAARFGEAAVTALRLLIGEQQAPIDALRPLAPLRFERRFAEPIGHQETIARCFADLLDEATQVLEERGLGGRQFRLTLFRSDGARHRLDIETGLPTRDSALVLRLFDERIAALADPLDPGFGYDSVGIVISRTEPLLASQPTLDGQEENSRLLAELLDRLQARLGPDSLYRLVLNDSHIPESAQFAVSTTRPQLSVHWPTLSRGEPPMRPLFLFDPPQPVEVIAEVPDGPPHRFRWRCKLHEVRLFEGPERIAPEWWRRKGGENPGEGGLTRDYYRIEDMYGRRYWIFRHGLYDEKPDPRWYLHGQFA